jgi:hypothetical protein
VTDVIDRPPHYTRSEIEPIDAIEAWALGFNLGNAVKYIARAGYKGDRLEDLKKAAWYVAREISREISMRTPRRECAAGEHLWAEWVASRRTCRVCGWWEEA